jgi:ribonucleoside-diphosphate reductase alpha chain
MLISTDGLYRIDKSNGLCRKETVTDYGYKIAKINGYKHTAGAHELSVDEHLRVLESVTKYIDMSASKTINMPADISFDDFKTIYSRIYKMGIKGCTTYRDGSMVGMLEDHKKAKKEKEKAIMGHEEFLEAFKDQKPGVVVQSVKLPTEYPAMGYILRSENKKWYIHLSFKDKAMTRPYAIFVNTNSVENNPSIYNALDKLEQLSRSVGLNGGLLDEVKRKYVNQKNPVKICRMLGFLLRHNVSILSIVKALDSVEEATVGSFVFHIKKFLSKYIIDDVDPVICQECGEKALIFQEGCMVCKSCGFSKCA